MNSRRARPAAGWTLAGGLAATLGDAARAAAPREACGVLLGTRTATGGHVAHVTAGRNRAGTDDTFELDPADFLAAEAAARAAGLTVVGFWHSHVASAPVPSPRDLAAAWPDHLLLIVGPLGEPLSRSFKNGPVELGLWLPARDAAEFAYRETGARG